MPAERQKVLDVFHEKRFQDMAPAEVYATLLDENIYLCSISTMYQILRSVGAVRERRVGGGQIALKRGGGIFTREKKKGLSETTAFSFSFRIVLIQFSVHVTIVARVRFVKVPTGFACCVHRSFGSTGP